jgi:hypothetical protein
MPQIEELEGAACQHGLRGTCCMISECLWSVAHEHRCLGSSVESSCMHLATERGFSLKFAECIKNPVAVVFS